MSIIHDRRGREYTVSESGSQDDFLRFNIKHRRHRVGYANCHFEGDDVLHLDGLHINNKAMRPPWFFVDLIFWIGSFPPERWRISDARRRNAPAVCARWIPSEG
jgi:hypothetical protein